MVIPALPLSQLELLRLLMLPGLALLAVAGSQAMAAATLGMGVFSVASIVWLVAITIRARTPDSILSA